MTGTLLDVETQNNRRFVKLDDVAELFSISSAQAYALVRRGDLPAIKLGGRGQWRVEVAEIDAYVERMYGATKEFIETHPFSERVTPTEDEQPAGDA